MGTLTDLASFLHDRWDEEEGSAALFHQLHCPVPYETTLGTCGCPGPARIIDGIATQRQTLRHHEQRIRRERDERPCWPPASVLAFQTMEALASPFELHPDWRDDWHP
ncbi:DUF6221 family protein [Streptomyces sp. NPDC008139]|uniref:DUF6221 family protein n=1 Tax=Streptomyces sp. NPDC008139 TaxID=3364814 RepID=UPI0036E54A5D